MKLQYLKDIFVDRKTVLQKIDDRLSDKTSSLIINIYGIGGMGKSHLIKKIENEIKTNYKLCGVVRLDLEHVSIDRIPNFEKITQTLTKYGFSFPCFYNAMIEYLSENEYIDRIPVFNKRLSEFPEMPDIATSFSKSIIEKSFNMPVNFILDISSTIDNASKRQNPYIKDFLSQYRLIPKEEKMKFLGLALYLDIINSPFHDNWKLVFIFDTYEKFYEQKYPLNTTSDQWLYEFVSNFLPIHGQKTNIDPIFIISGRDPIYWEKRGDLPELLIDKIPALEKLEKVDCDEYLMDGKIPHIYHNAIFKQCNGYPFPLQMLAFLYFQLEERGEVSPTDIELSAGDYDTLYKTIIRHLPDNIVILLESLAFCSWFDRKILNKIAVNLHHLSWSEQSFDHITGYAFCKKIEGEKYCLQPTFQEILKKNYSIRLPNAFPERKHNTLFNYYSDYYEKEKDALDDFSKVLLIREICIQSISTSGKQQIAIKNLKILCTNYQDFSFVSNFILMSLQHDVKLFNVFSEVIETYIQQFSLINFQKFMKLLSSENDIDQKILEDLKNKYFTKNYSLMKEINSKNVNALNQYLRIIKKCTNLHIFLKNFSNEDYSRIISKSSFSQIFNFLIGMRNLIGYQIGPLTKEESRFISVFFERDVHTYKVKNEEQFIHYVKRFYLFFKRLDNQLFKRYQEKIKWELSSDEKEKLIFLGIAL